MPVRLVGLALAPRESLALHVAQHGELLLEGADGAEGPCRREVKTGEPEAPLDFLIRGRDVLPGVVQVEAEGVFGFQVGDLALEGALVLEAGNGGRAGVGGGKGGRRPGGGSVLVKGRLGLAAGIALEDTEGDEAAEEGEVEGVGVEEGHQARGGRSLRGGVRVLGGHVGEDEVAQVRCLDVLEVLVRAEES